MKRKCKTCGRTVGQYAYGGGHGWRTHYEQRVGKIAKDRWLQANSIPSIVKMRKKLFGSFQTIQTHMVCFVELCVWKHT